jgi:fibronectin-binding autotransporter adhesin
MRPLGSPAHRRPAIANLEIRKPGAARRGLLGVLLAAAVFGGPWGGASWIAHAATLDLNGTTVTLPDGVVFTTPYLTGSNGVTNSSSTTSGEVVEGGGPAGTIYSGIISNGASSTAWVHTGGDVIITGANSQTGGTFIQGGNVTISGTGTLGGVLNSVSVTGGGVLDLGRTTQTQNGLVRLFGGTIQNGTLSSFDAFLVQSGTISAVLAGTGELQQSTAGRVTLLGANTYSGETNIFGGTLQIGGAGSLGGGSYSQTIGINFGASTFEYSSSAAQTLSGDISGTGALTKDTSSSTLTLTGANTYTGGTTIAAGTLQIGAGGTTGSIVGGVVDNGTLAFDRADNANFGGAISGTGSLTQLGVGTLTLTGANTYSGSTTVFAGTLMGGALNAFSNASAMTVDASGTLDLGGHDQTVQQLAGAGVVTNTGVAATLFVNETAGLGSVFSGAIRDGTGVVGLDVNGSFGPLTLNNPGGNTYSGTTTVESGATLMAGANNAFSANSPTTVQGTLDLGGFAETIPSVALSGGTIQNGNLTSSDGIFSTGGFVRGISGSTSLFASSGVTALYGSNGYAGATAILNGATVIAGGENSFSSSSATTVNAGGTLDLSGFDETVSSLAGGGAVTNSDALHVTLTNQGASSTFSGGINDGAGVVALTESSPGATLTLSGTNTYSGATTVDAGTLMGGATNAFSAASATTVDAGGTLDLGGFDQTVRELAGAGLVTSTGGAATLFVNETASPGSTFGGAIRDGPGSGNTLSLDVSGSPLAPLTLSNSGGATYSGTTTIESGATLMGGANNAFSPNSATTVAATGTLDLGGFNQTVASLSGGGTVTNSGPTPATLTNVGASSTFSGVIVDGGPTATIGLTQDSTVGGTLTLTGGNTYSGATTVAAGTLKAGANFAFSEISAMTVNTGGTLDLGGFVENVRSLSGGGTVTSNGAGPGTLNVGGVSTSSTFSGSIRDGTSTTGLTWNGLPGTLTLTGTNTYTGPTNIFNGTLRGGAPNTFSAASPTLVGGTLDLGGFTQTINNVVVSGNGTIENGSLVGAIVAGGGEAVVSGISGPASLTAGFGVVMENGNSFTGPTVINSGGILIGLTANAFSPNSPMTVSAGGTLRLTLGFDQTVASLSGDGLVTNHWPIPVTLTNVGASSTFSGLIQDTVGTIGLTQDSTVGGTLTLSGANTYSGPTTVQAGTLMGGATDAFSAASATTVNAGGTLDLGGLGQTIDAVVTLAGGVIRNGALTSVSGITSTGGTIDGIGGTTGLTVNSGVTTLKTTTGANTYSGATTINGGTLLGGATNAFSAASATTVNSGGTLDLGGLGQTINTVNLAGGVIQNGVLTSVNGITSTGGTLNQMTVSTSATDGHALHVAGAGAQLNLVGTNTFATQGAGAIGLYASLGGFVMATGATNITTSGGGASGVNADGAGAQIKLGTANVATAGFGAFGLFASDASASGGAGSISTTGTLNVSTGNPAAAAIGLQGNSASILATGGGKIASAGDAIEFLGGTNQTATFDSFDISTQSGDIVFADPSTATITFNNSTVDAGTGYLLDATSGSVITFNASASALTGAMATDAVSTSNVNLTNGTVWNLTGPSNVTSLAVTNSAIVFAPPGAGGFKTLTVGNYVGSGANVVLNTALGGSSSPTDRIVVSGGSATGDTVLTIRNAGGVGGLTTGAGIPIVTTTNGGTTASNAFALSGTPILNGYRYTLDDSGGDWYLVSSPTTTQSQVQNSINAVAKAQQNQIVTNLVLASILLGATEQISCSSCGSGFGSIGSLGLGAHGRLGLSDQLTAMGGFSYNQSSSNGIGVYDAPIFAGSLVYDFSNLGDSRPFVEAGGGLTPYEQVQYSRNYPNGYGTALGTAAAVNRVLFAFARLGWLARLSPTDEAAVYGDLSRSVMQTGGYSEATTAINPFPATVAPGLDTLNVARIGGQYTRLFNGAIEANVSAAVAYGFGAGSGSVVNVNDFGPIAPSALPNTTWFEYGARIGYRVSDSLVVDAFLIGTAGGAIGATAHGGIALRVAF